MSHPMRRVTFLKRLAIAGSLMVTAAVATPTAAQGTGPFTVAATIPVTFSSQVTATSGYAFVASSSAISVIDASTNTVARTLPTTGAIGPQGSVAVGDRVYFANNTSGTITILDTSTWTVSYLVTGMCAAPDSLLALSATRLVVGCIGQPDPVTNPGAIQVIDIGGTPSVLQTVTVGVTPATMSSSGALVYVPNSRSGTVSVVDTSASPATEDTVSVGGQPEATTYLGGKVYVADFSGNSVTIVNASVPYSVSSSVGVGSQPQSIAACSGAVFTANRDSGSASVINATSGSVDATIPLAGAGAVTHVVRVHAGYAFFANYVTANVSIVDCSTLAVVATVPTVSGPSSFAFSSGYAYVAGSTGLTAIALTSPPTPAPPPPAPAPAPAMMPASQELVGTVGAPVTPTARFTLENFTLVPGYLVYPTLPEGLTLDPVSGVVSGTPTQEYPLTRHWITATAGGNAESAYSALQVSVNPVPDPPPPPPPTPTIVITGVRDVGLVNITGTATEFGPGDVVTAYTRTRRGDPYTPGATVLVNASDGFTWSRAVAVRKTLWVYFTGGGVRSEAVVLYPRVPRAGRGR